MRLKAEDERGAQARSSAYLRPASTEQLQLIRSLGGRPRDDLTDSQAKKAITALRQRARQKDRNGA